MEKLKAQDKVKTGEDNDEYEEEVEQKTTCLEKLLCIKHESEEQDVFHEELFKQDNDKLCDILKGYQQDEILMNYKDTLRIQEERRNTVYNKIARRLKRKIDEIDLEEFKTQLDKNVIFKSNETDFFRNMDDQGFKPSFGNEKNTNYDNQTETLWKIRESEYYKILKKYPEERRFFIKCLFLSFSSPNSYPCFDNKVSMTYYDLNKMLKIIGLDNYIFKQRFNAAEKIGSKSFLKEKFLEYSDVKRFYLSKKFAQSSLEKIIEKAAFTEPGLSFEAFLSLMGILSSIIFLGEKIQLKEPLSKFTLLVFELSMVFMKDFKEVIMNTDMSKYYEINIIQKNGQNRKQKIYKRPVELEIKLSNQFKPIYTVNLEDDSPNGENDIFFDFQNIDQIEKNLKLQQENSENKPLLKENSLPQDNLEKNYSAKKITSKNLLPLPSIKSGKMILTPPKKIIQKSDTKTDTQIESKEEGDTHDEEIVSLTAKEEKLLVKEAQIRSEKIKRRKQNCFKACLSLLKTIFSKCLGCLKYCLLMIIAVIFEGYMILTEGLVGIIMKKTKCIFTAFGMVDEADIIAEKEKEVTKKEPQDWKEVAKFLNRQTKIHTLKYATDTEGAKIMLNASNGLIILGNVNTIEINLKFIGIILAYYTTIKDIKWFKDDKFDAQFTEPPPSLWFYEKFLFRFILTSIIGFVNLIAVLIAAKYIKEGTLGINPKTGRRAEFPQIQYMISKILMLLGDTLFALTMGNFAQLYSCDYGGEDPKKWNSSLDSSMTCFTGKHSLYLYFSSFWLFTYLLSATSLFPTFQFDDPSLDIKFSANYIILRTECEVFLVFVTTVIGSINLTSNNRYIRWILSEDTRKHSIPRSSLYFAHLFIHQKAMHCQRIQLRRSIFYCLSIDPNNLLFAIPIFQKFGNHSSWLDLHLFYDDLFWMLYRIRTQTNEQKEGEQNYTC